MNVAAAAAAAVAAVVAVVVVAASVAFPGEQMLGVGEVVGSKIVADGHERTDVNVVYIFLSLPLMRWTKNALFALGEAFHPNLIFAGTIKNLPLTVGKSGLVYKKEALLKSLANDKRSSLLVQRIRDKEKNVFFNMCTWC